MSPPLLLLGILSTLTVWLITSLGLPPNLWTFGVVPLLSVYLLCDQGKLWQAAVQVGRSPVEILGAAIVAVFSIFYAQFVLWRICVLLGCLLCLVKAFDPEKKLYMGNTYGAMAKSILWKVINSFTSEAKWMTYRGEWAYCSPYSRKLVRQDVDHYYTLQKHSGVQDDTIPENYELDFSIEACKVACTYTDAGEYRSHASGEYIGAGSAVVPGHEENVPSSTPTAFPLEKKKVEIQPDSSGTTSLQGESSSSKTKGVVIEDRYTLKACHVNKLEVSLQYENETLESYTFYDREFESMAEVKRALEVLKNEGNLIFSSLNRDVGSRIPRAHARCYEFEEIFELVLNRNYKLHRMNLQERHVCSISGYWGMQLQVVLMAVMALTNYYQLTHTPSLRIAVALVTLYIIIHLLSALGKYAGQKQHKLRRFVHYIISRIAPSKVDRLYRFFQVHVPWLTFCNESYGYPYTSSQRQVCLLRGTYMQLPLIGTENPRDLQLDFLREGTRVFDLRTLQLELSVSSGDDREIRVDVLMRRSYDGECCCHKIYFTDERRGANLIALMKWLEDNSCVGVCKEWPKRKLMHAYTYEELFVKVLRDGAKPMTIDLISPIDISVEGI